MIPREVADRVKTVCLEVEGQTLSLETGLLAEQAHGAVMARYGDTMVLGAVVGDREPKENLDFFPLTIDYEEKMYAAGKIPGGFIKREGRPTEQAILAARLTDRPLRPLFPKGYKAEVQIINTVMSTDQENDPAVLSIIAASAALAISPIPFGGPIGAVRVGLIDGEVVINPPNSALEDSALNAVLAGTASAIMMVEGEADQIDEETLLSAFKQGHEEIKRIVALQEELVALAGVEKWPFSPPEGNPELASRVRSLAGDRLRDVVRNPDKTLRSAGTKDLQREVVNALSTPSEGQEPAYDSKEVNAAFEALVKEEVRAGILEERIRPDGRGPEEIRPIWSMVGYLPRTHGSAIFTRGQTQALTTVTLGSTGEAQRMDSISREDRKRYIHHYNFPPFSVGEVRRLRGSSRRDIGHGALAERALLAVIPSEEEFPYTLRLVSEVVSSNGSTSMASVCASTLALMDAGVPISAPVAGVAMGLVTDSENNRFTVLSDIQGIEDALGDMDFKVAGTTKGVTAIQMDIKVQGISWDVLSQALQQAHTGRQHILGKMLETISEYRDQLSVHAPLVRRIKVNPEKIGAIIGPGGKMIRALQDETGTKIDIEDDGTVSISSANAAGVEQAVTKIQGLTQEFTIERGERYTGKVVSIMPFGAFVELVPGKDGLVHISELSENPSIRVERVEDVLDPGDEITVMVIDVAQNGKVSLSRRAAITGELPPPKGERPPRREGGGPPRSEDRPRGGGPPPREREGGFGRPADSRPQPPLGDRKHS